MKYTPLFKTMREVEEILDKLDEVGRKYGMIMVSDLYDLAGIPSLVEDAHRGWAHVRNAEVVKVGKYYVLDMPIVQEDIDED